MLSCELMWVAVPPWVIEETVRWWMTFNLTLSEINWTPDTQASLPYIFHSIFLVAKLKNLGTILNFILLVTSHILFNKDPLKSPSSCIYDLTVFFLFTPLPSWSKPLPCSVWVTAVEWWEFSQGKYPGNFLGAQLDRPMDCQGHMRHRIHLRGLGPGSGVGTAPQQGSTCSVRWGSFSSAQREQPEL